MTERFTDVEAVRSGLADVDYLADDGIAGEVSVVEELGSEAFVHVLTEHQGAPLTLVVRHEGETTIQRGDRVHVEVDGPIHVFAPSGERVGD